MLGALAQQGAKYERERHERAERQGAVGADEVMGIRWW
jgi:hypothetical protein